MLSRKRLLPKRRLEFQVEKKKKKKKQESAGPSARGNESASNISQRKKGIQNMEDDCCPIDTGEAARQKDLKFRGWIKISHP